MQNDALESAIREMNLTGDEHWNSLLGESMDEQPHLFAFLFNLADDFSEEVHEQLLRETVVLLAAFRKAGVEIDLITPAGLDKIIGEKVDLYESLAEEDNLNPEAMEGAANSPQVFDRVRKHIMNQLGDYMPILDESQANLNLMVDILISAMEEHAVLGSDDSNENPETDA